MGENENAHSFMIRVGTSYYYVPDTPHGFYVTATDGYMLKYIEVQSQTHAAYYFSLLVNT